MEHQAAFYMYRHIRVPSAQLEAEIAGLLAEGDQYGAKVREIEQHITRGHEHYNARRYQPALDEYLQARALINSMVVGSPVPPKLPPEHLLPGDLLDHLVIEVADVLPRLPVDPDWVTRPPASGFQLPHDSFTGATLQLGLSAGAEAVGSRAWQVNEAVSFARVGRLNEARELLERVLDAGSEMDVTTATAFENLGAVFAAEGEHDRADSMLKRAEAGWRALGLADRAAAIRDPANNRRRTGVFRKVDPDLLGIVIRDGRTGPRKRLRVMVAETASPPVVLDLNLIADDLGLRVRTEYYARRLHATTVEQLGVTPSAVISPGRFELDVPHHYGFTLCVGIGKAYRQLGRFEDALGEFRAAAQYKYINRRIEVPFLWVEFARTYLEWGNHLYRRDDRAGAREHYTRIVNAVLSSVDLDPTSELYSIGIFADVKAAVTLLIPELESPSEGGAAIDPQIELIVRQAYQRLRMIEAGLNWFGLTESPVTVFRYEYLQALARYFADQAIKAERDYINFWTNGERETQSLMQLEQAVEVANDNLELEARRVAEAKAMQAAAAAAVHASEVRLQNAQDRKAEYETLGQDLIALDTATAHSSGGFTETEGGYNVYLNSAGGTVSLGDEDYEIMRNAAYRRGQIRFDMEMADMQRAIADLATQKATSEAQAAVADTRVEVAKQGEIIAQTRKRHAEANLAYAQNKQFTSELWFNLADVLRDISRTYLERAIEVAKLMQEAYNFEYDQSLRVVKSDYASREELAGLLAGDLLKADIDYFPFHRVTQVTRKPIPAKVIWSIAERHPSLLHTFRRTGVLQFETRVEQFNELFPGTYLHKVKAIEVVVEGLISADGVHGRLSNSGISVYRNRNGKTAIRIQPAETQLISGHDLARDTFVFRPSQEYRGVFEGSGVASGWTLAIPVGTNDLDFESVRDVRLAFYFESYHDPLLEAATVASLPPGGSWQRTYGLASEFPDGFFRFQETGKLAFDSRAGDFPLHHADLTIESIAVWVLTKPGIAPVATLTLGHDGTPHTATFTTDPTTASARSDVSDPSNPLTAFVGSSPIGEWLLDLDVAANPDLVNDPPTANGLVSGIRDVVVAFGYAFSRRQQA